MLSTLANSLGWQPLFVIMPFMRCRAVALHLEKGMVTNSGCQPKEIASVEITYRIGSQHMLQQPILDGDCKATLACSSTSAWWGKHVLHCCFLLVVTCCPILADTCLFWAVPLLLLIPVNFRDQLIAVYDAFQASLTVMGSMAAQQPRTLARTSPSGCQSTATLHQRIPRGDQKRWRVCAVRLIEV